MNQSITNTKNKASCNKCNSPLELIDCVNDNCPIKLHMKNKKLFDKNFSDNELIQSQTSARRSLSLCPRDCNCIQILDMFDNEGCIIDKQANVILQDKIGICGNCKKTHHLCLFRNCEACIRIADSNAGIERCGPTLFRSFSDHLAARHGIGEATKKKLANDLSKSATKRTSNSNRDNLENEKKKQKISSSTHFESADSSTENLQMHTEQSPKESEADLLSKIIELQSQLKTLQENVSKKHKEYDDFIQSIKKKENESQIHGTPSQSETSSKTGLDVDENRSTCTFSYIRQKDILHITATGAEYSWEAIRQIPHLMQFDRKDEPLKGTFETPRYFITKSKDANGNILGPQIFALADSRVWYNDKNGWHMYRSASLQDKDKAIDDYHYIIFFSLRSDFEYFRDCLWFTHEVREWKTVNYKDIILLEFKVREKKCGAVISFEQGNKAMQMHVMRVSQHFHPKYFILMGTSGCLDNSRVGDVVIAKDVVDLEYNTKGIQFLSETCYFLDDKKSLVPGTKFRGIVKSDIKTLEGIIPFGQKFILERELKEGDYRSRVNPNDEDVIELKKNTLYHYSLTYDQRTLSTETPDSIYALSLNLHDYESWCNKTIDIFSEEEFEMLENLNKGWSKNIIDNGKIVCGEHIIYHDGFRDFVNLAGHEGAICVDRESAGFLYAIKKTNFIKNVVIIRAVSINSDQFGENENLKLQELSKKWSMMNAANFFLLICNSFVDI